MRKLNATDNGYVRKLLNKPKDGTKVGLGAKTLEM
jgi:hypothetical protein